MPAQIPTTNRRALIYGLTIGALLLWARLLAVFHSALGTIIGAWWPYLIGSWAIMAFSTKFIFKSQNWRIIFFISGFTGFLSKTLYTILLFLLYDSQYELGYTYSILTYALFYVTISETCLYIYKKRS